MLATRWVAAASAALLAWGVWNLNALPTVQAIRPELLTEPRQTNGAQAEFKVQARGITYGIKPLAEYELQGLVVSRHDTHTWWDHIHRDTRDHLNVADLCVVWGDNLTSGVYRELAYSSGQFTCHVSSDKGAIWQRFKPEQLSNNHLLTDRPELARRLKDVRVGDQIALRGLLAEYRHNEGFAYVRGTSLVRSDTGNGACETVFVTDFRVLKRANTFARWAVGMGACLLLAWMVAWFAQPHRSAE